MSNAVFLNRKVQVLVLDFEVCSVKGHIHYVYSLECSVLSYQLGLPSL